MNGKKVLINHQQMYPLNLLLNRILYYKNYFYLFRSVRTPLNITINSAASTPTANTVKTILSPLGSSSKTPVADLKPMARERSNSISTAAVSPSARSRSNSTVSITPPAPAGSTLNSVLPNVSQKFPSPSPPTKSNSPPKSPRSIHRTSFTDPNATSLHPLMPPARPISPAPGGLSTHLPKPSELGTSKSPLRSPSSNSPRNVIDKNGGFFNKLSPLSPTDNGGSPGFKQVRTTQALYKPSTISSIDFQLESKNPAMLAAV